jgi:hypothetical protein
VLLAAFEEVLGPRGLRQLRRGQKRIRARLEKKRMENPDYGAPIVVDKEEEDGPVTADSFMLSKDQVITKQNNLEDPQMRGHIDNVLRLGWERMVFPKNFTLCHLAASKGDMDAIEILADAKADFGVIDDMKGQTAVQWAIEFHNMAAANLITSIMKAFGQTPHTGKTAEKDGQDEAATYSDKNLRAATAANPSLPMVNAEPPRPTHKSKRLEPAPKQRRRTTQARSDLGQLTDAQAAPKRVRQRPGPAFTDEAGGEERRVRAAKKRPKTEGPKAQRDLPSGPVVEMF